MKTNSVHQDLFDHQLKLFYYIESKHFELSVIFVKKIHKFSNVLSTNSEENVNQHDAS